jgi:anti-anti-sigma regulatory factor
MLRITTQETNEAVRFQLEGKLGGPWVAEMERAFAASTGKPIVVDLQGLTGADAAGRNLIAQMQREGAALQNSSPLQSHTWTGMT